MIALYVLRSLSVTAVLWPQLELKAAQFMELAIPTLQVGVEISTSHPVACFLPLEAEGVSGGNHLSLRVLEGIFLLCCTFLVVWLLVVSGLLLRTYGVQIFKFGYFRYFNRVLLTCI